MLEVVKNNSLLKEAIGNKIPDESFFQRKILVLTNFIYDETFLSHDYIFSFFENGMVYMNFTVKLNWDTNDSLRQDLFAISMDVQYKEASFSTYCS